MKLQFSDRTCRSIARALLPFAVNIALPLIVYHFAAPHLGESNGLMLCSVPVILWSLSEIVRFRRLDAISLLALLGIFLSLGAMAIGGNARFLLLRESLVTGMIGIVFLGSLLFPHPLMYFLARSGEAKRLPQPSQGCCLKAKE
ncbi:MAG: hypothetical protein JO170_05880 [Verrucomicrobia bacterium]|nr:hypothetical protein [Verrucomicrobiota bacterium]